MSLRVQLPLFILSLLAMGLLAGCGGGGGPTSTVGTITGTVYQADGQAVLAFTRAISTPPAVGAEVTVLGTNLRTITDSMGHFQLTNVPAGAQTVVVSYKGFPALYATVAVKGGATVSTNELETPAGDTGQVDGTFSLESAGSTPAVGADIFVLGTTLHTTTDANGHFLFQNVPIGLRQVLVSRSGYQSASYTVNVLKDTLVSVGNNTLPSASRKWTILVYMNADNDLEMYGVQDVNEMESVMGDDPLNGPVTVAVQMDRSDNWDTSNGNWTDTKRFLITHDDDMYTMASVANSPVRQEMGEVDMGQPDTLNDFIQWGKQNFPAEHTMVIIWNHGSGWRSRASTAEVAAATRGVSFDDKTGTYIKTVELPSALQTNPPLDILSFDASLMQMLEIAYEIRTSSRYIVGSEESPPGAGYPYHRWLGPLVQNPSMTPVDLSTLMAQETRDYYGLNSDVTHSVLDTGKLAGLANALGKFGEAMGPVSRSYATQLAEARSQAEHYAYYTEYKDLYDYARLVKAKVPNAGVQAAADAVMAAVNDTVIAEYHGSMHPNSHGVSISVPTPDAFGRMAPDYLGLALANNTYWDEWLGLQEN